MRIELNGPLKGLSISVMTMPMTATGVTTGRKIMVRNSVESLISLLLSTMARISDSTIWAGTVPSMNTKDRQKAAQKKLSASNSV